MLAHHARLILADVYATWERGDLDTTLSYCTSHRDALAFQLERFARQFAVEEFRLQLLRTEGILLVSTVAFRYRHRATRLDVDGQMRHKWLFIGDEIAGFELFHDARRMRAFYDLAQAGVA
jgi:hypothetical protein